MCECAEKINEKLAEYNGKISMAILLSADRTTMSGRICIATEKLDSNKRAKRMPAVTANYCPFCGEPKELLNKP